MRGAEDLNFVQDKGAEALEMVQKALQEKDTYKERRPVLAGELGDATPLAYVAIDLVLDYEDEYAFLYEREKVLAKQALQAVEE